MGSVAAWGLCCCCDSSVPSLDRSARTFLLIPCPATAVCITYPFPKRKQRHVRKDTTPASPPRDSALVSCCLSSLANPARWTLHNRQLAKRSHSTFAPPSHSHPTPSRAAYQPNMAPAATGEDAPIQTPYCSSKPSSIFASVLYGPRDLRLVSNVGNRQRVHGELTEANTPTHRSRRLSKIRESANCRLL